MEGETASFLILPTGETGDGEAGRGNQSRGAHGLAPVPEMN